MQQGHRYQHVTAWVYWSKISGVACEKQHNTPACFANTAASTKSSMKLTPSTLLGVPVTDTTSNCSRRTSNSTARACFNLAACSAGTFTVHDNSCAINKDPHYARLQAHMLDQHRDVAICSLAGGSMLSLTVMPDVGLTVLVLLMRPLSGTIYCSLPHCYT